MKIAVLKERRPHETRVAGVPETIRKLIGLGAEVVVEKGAGKGASISDEAYRDAGATIAASAKSALEGAEIVLKIQSPMTAAEGTDELSEFTSGQVLICQIQARSEADRVQALADAGITAFALEMAPRITRAQAMDILSSQSNLAGYKSVLDAAAEFGRAFPMMMTAAGTVPPAQMRSGHGRRASPGLQAIATARRLGAVVSASDVRPAAKEQVESARRQLRRGRGRGIQAQAQTVRRLCEGNERRLSRAKQAALIAETIHQAGYRHLHGA